MIIKSKTIINKFEEVFYAVFSSDEFVDKYAHFFDRLIVIEELDAKRYEETNEYIQTLSEHLNDLSYLTKLILDMPCDYMFDIYYRYHILVEYLLSKDTVTVSTYRDNKLFYELLTRIWLLGIPTFEHKYF